MKIKTDIRVKDSKAMRQARGVKTCTGYKSKTEFLDIAVNNVDAQWPWCQLFIVKPWLP